MYILIPCLFIIFCCILQCKYLYSDAVQLWEETEADNRRLMSEMARVRGELKDTKYQMENISSKVIRQLKLGLQPCLHHLNIDWRGD